MANAPRPTVRIGLDEDGVRSDNARLAGISGELVYRSERRVRLVEIGIHRLLCRVAVPPFVDPWYCPRDRGLVHTWTFSYGWQVHRLSPSGAPA
jgi:hypothetical protein